MTLLADATWPDVGSGGGVLLVPVGATEQHGPHLPLDTDTTIATAVAHRVAELVTGSWVAPPVAYGSSGEHQGFPGTLSIGTDALVHLIVELARSARHWADRAVLVNAHGGNVEALNRALTQLRAEGHSIGWLPCLTDSADLHAGRTETSLMLHLRPEAVRLERAESGNTRPLAELWASMVAGGVRAVSENGVLGDPAGASAEEGAELLEAMAHRISTEIRDSIR